MKIVYLVPRPNVGGLQTTLRNRIHALQAFNIHAEVFFFGRGDGEYIFKNIPYFFIKSKSEFRDKIERGNYDYISFIYSLEYLCEVPNSFVGKIIYEIRGWNGEIANYIKGINRSHKVDGVLCIAKYLKQLVYRNLKIKVPVYVDGNTVHSMFQYMNPQSRVWGKIPTPRSGHKVIGFVGRVQKSKNWYEFMRICKILSKFVDIEMWIICNPNTSKDLATLLDVSSQWGLKRRVRVIPLVPNQFMPEVYSAIKDSRGCILSTSRREGLGNHILEPMACSLPVVSTNVPGKNEIISHRYNGMLYKLGEINRAVRYVKSIIEDQELRVKIEKNGLRTIRRQYNPQKYASRYLDILSKI
jgi:glycosyltransferase involved in cell wall biosynthesis